MFILGSKILTLNISTLTYLQVMNNVKIIVNKINIYYRNQNKLNKELI